MKVFLLMLFICTPGVLFAETTTNTMVSTAAVTTTTTGSEGSGSGSEGTETATTTPSTTTTTTLGPCIAGEQCSSDRNCTAGYVKTPYGSYCAEPCNNEYAWCEGGETCVADSDVQYACKCAVGFYSSGDSSCVAGKFFGGEITFTDPYDDANREQTMMDIEGILTNIYGASTGFKNATVLDVRSGSTIAEYILTYDETADDALVENTFYAYTSDCNSTINSSSYTLDCAASNNSVINSTVLCGSSDYNDCNETTTQCQNADGVTWCSCRDGYARTADSSTACLKVTCNISSACNDPFGSCIPVTGSEYLNFCECMWGFSGPNCYSPWEFVFTIVTAGLGLILIIVIIVFCCKSQKMKAQQNKHIQDDLNLKNPFVDFQPGLVRAKLPSSLSNAYASLDLQDGYQSSSNKRNSYSNGAYSHAEDPYQKKPNSFQNEYQSASLNAPGKSNDTDYF